MKNKVLFILPTVGTGGIVSSYIPLYQSIKDDADIKTLFLVNDAQLSFPFSESIIMDRVLCLYYDALSSFNLFQIIPALVLKFIKRKNQKKGIALSETVGKYVAKRLMRHYNFDIVVGFSEGAPTKLASFFNSSKVLSWIHCDYKQYYDVVCRKQDELYIYNRINTIVCVSEYTRLSFCSIYPSLAQKVQSVNNLLDIERIQKLSKEPIDDKRFQNEKFTIISVGRINPVKRFSVIPIIARGLKNLGLDFKWYILGPESDIGEASLLSKRIKEYSVTDTVIWLGGKSNPYSYMAHCNLYVCLSSSEACPMVFNEAKVLGLPIVTTNFGSAKEFIENGSNGIITEIDNLQEVLSSLIRDKDKTIVLKDSIRVTGFDNTAVLQQLNELLH